MSDLLNRLAKGDVLVLDGGNGTELERRGIPLTGDAAWGECFQSHSDIVKQVHVDYVAAGADIITTNTYSTGLATLSKINKADVFGDWNKRAVDLARDAIRSVSPSRPVYVAGSVSSYGNGAMNLVSANNEISWAASSEQELTDSFHRQALVLAESGVDFIALEMLCATGPNIARAVSAVSEIGLPIMLSLSGIASETHGKCVLQEIDDDQQVGFGENAESIESVVASINDKSVSIVSAMHSAIGSIAPLVQTIRRNWEGPIGVYPNRTGFWDGEKWVFTEEVTPESYGRLALEWINASAQIIGGCCGVTPDQIRGVRNAIDLANTA